MVYNSDLKIEFRAIPYFNNVHKLEYRISPDQDITYEVTKSFLGLFKYKTKRKYDTSWQVVEMFDGKPSYIVKEEFCWIPITCKTYSDFEWYKNKFQTVGEFWDYLNEINEPRRKEWLNKKENIWR